MYHGHQAGERSKENEWWEASLILPPEYRVPPAKVHEKYTGNLGSPKGEEVAMASEASTLFHEGTVSVLFTLSTYISEQSNRMNTKILTIAMKTLVKPEEP